MTDPIDYERLAATILSTYDAQHTIPTPAGVQRSKQREFEKYEGPVPVNALSERERTTFEVKDVCGEPNADGSKCQLRLICSRVFQVSFESDGASGGQLHYDQSAKGTSRWLYCPQHGPFQIAPDSIIRPKRADKK
jgi:hypothetical protein